MLIWSFAVDQFVDCDHRSVVRTFLFLKCSIGNWLKQSRCVSRETSWWSLSRTRLLVKTKRKCFISIRNRSFILIQWATTTDFGESSGKRFSMWILRYSTERSELHEASTQKSVIQLERCDCVDGSGFMRLKINIDEFETSSDSSSWRKMTFWFHPSRLFSS